MALADKIVVMNGGKIAQAGTAREIFNTPKSEFVAKFIGATMFLGMANKNSRCALTA